MEELKKCPLCKGDPKHDDHKTHIEIYCPKCGLSIERATKEEAEKAWNRRD